MYKNLGMIAEHTPSATSSAGPSPPLNSPLFHVFDLFSCCFDLRPAGFAAQVKHPHMLSGESDPVGLG